MLTPNSEEARHQATDRSIGSCLRVSVLLLLACVGCAKSEPIRFATFNASLNRDAPGKLIADLSTPDDKQAQAVAEIIQRVRPDVILVNEFDADESGEAARLFRTNYLQRGQNGAEPIFYPYAFSGAVNTGVASGFDLDNDGVATTQPGTRAYGGDALGFGTFPGQYGMLILSNRPILADQVRSLRELKWKDMPGALLPVKPDGSPWYDDAELARLPLSSKAHWDVPIVTADRRGRVVHLLVSHPTPPAFDGPEDRNGRRNHDEIRLWADYITGGEPARYITGPAEAIGPRPRKPAIDTTLQGGFRGGAIAYPNWPTTFVILGDLNADPNDGASLPGAIQQLLHHPRVNAGFVPASDGAVEAAQRQGGANAGHRSDPGHDTADFGDTGSAPGNLRCDYVLPSRDLKIIDGGVFWPVEGDPLHRLVRGDASSDHRLVWLDVRIP